MTMTTVRRRPDGGGGGASCTLCTASSAKLLMRAFGCAATSTSRAVVVTLAWVAARPLGRLAWTESTAAGVQASLVAGSCS